VELRDLSLVEAAEEVWIPGQGEVEHETPRSAGEPQPPVVDFADDRLGEIALQADVSAVRGVDDRPRQVLSVEALDRQGEAGRDQRGAALAALGAAEQVAGDVRHGVTVQRISVLLRDADPGGLGVEEGEADAAFVLDLERCLGLSDLIEEQGLRRLPDRGRKGRRRVGRDAERRAVLIEAHELVTRGGREAAAPLAVFRFVDAEAGELRGHRRGRRALPRRRLFVLGLVAPREFSLSAKSGFALQPSMTGQAAAPLRVIPIHCHSAHAAAVSGLECGDGRAVAQPQTAITTSPSPSNRWRMAFLPWCVCFARVLR
jgi:hypothetical protein